MPLKKPQTSCIIVGGGISGLITATILQRNNIQVTVLDKGRGIGGRLATRRIQKGVFDYGAQYFSVESSVFQQWVDEWLEAEVISQWCQQFTAEDRQKPRYRGNISNRNIAKHLAKDLEVHTSTRVIKLDYQNGRWCVKTEKNQFHSDMLVLTSPVPQSLTLLKESQITVASDIKTALEKITYHQCIAVLALLEKPSKIPPPGGIIIEKEPLVWIADNYQKGISRHYGVTIHASPQFSQANREKSDATIAELLFDAASPWLNDSVIEYQVHRWRYSLPATFYHQPYCAIQEPPLVMAGDAFVAPKIEGAALSGIAAADYILKLR